MSAHSLRPLYSTAVQHRCTGTGTVIPTGILLAVLLVSYGNKSQYHSSVSPRNKSLRTVTGMKSSPLPSPIHELEACSTTYFPSMAMRAFGFALRISRSKSTVDAATCPASPRILARLLALIRDSGACRQRGCKRYR